MEIESTGLYIKVEPGRRGVLVIETEREKVNKQRKKSREAKKMTYHLFFNFRLFFSVSHLLLFYPRIAKRSLTIDIPRARNTSPQQHHISSLRIHTDHT